MAGSTTSATTVPNAKKVKFSATRPKPRETPRAGKTAKAKPADAKTPTKPMPGGGTMARARGTKGSTKAAQTPAARAAAAKGWMQQSQAARAAGGDGGFGRAPAPQGKAPAAAAFAPKTTPMTNAFKGLPAVSIPKIGTGAKKR